MAPAEDQNGQVLKTLLMVQALMIQRQLLCCAKVPEKPKNHDGVKPELQKTPLVVGSFGTVRVHLSPTTGEHIHVHLLRPSLGCFSATTCSNQSYLSKRGCQDICAEFFLYAEKMNGCSNCLTAL